MTEITRRRRTTTGDRVAVTTDTVDDIAHLHHKTPMNRNL
jgi:hypothetical protein